MAIIVEDGNIIANANSYVSELELTNFATARNITLVLTAEQLLIQAMDYIESLLYQGVKRTRGQGLQWPRMGVVIDGYIIDSITIPQELRNGLMQTALAIDSGVGPQVNTVRQTIVEKVGDLEVHYAPGSTNSERSVKIMSALYKLLLSGGAGSNVIRVSKG